jgi:phosphoribosylamine--glycine ligase
MEACATCVPLQANDLQGLLRFAREKRIDLTVVGPEQPLAAGIVDLFASEGLRIFGPTREAARLEWSKSFAKEFMQRHGIPTSSHRVFRPGEGASVESYLRDASFPLVLKADGLAAGKGVLICGTAEEAVAGFKGIVEDRMFGPAAGESVVIEEFLEGEEASVFAVCDGKDYALLSPAQDHKRIFDGDRGKNTGGMGSYAPAPLMGAPLLDRVREQIVEPVLQGMLADGTAYRGCLYVGLMITPDGPKVVEFNSRFGDPETQVVLPLLDGDFGGLLMAAATGTLSSWNSGHHISPNAGAAVCVVLASSGYPDSYQTGMVIRGLDLVAEMPGIMVFHAGTRRHGAELVTAGGRVLGVTSFHGGGDLAAAIQQAYGAVSRISFDGMQFRKDIGRKALRQQAGVQ